MSVGPCQCGHTISEHSFYMSFSATPDLHCTGCDLCDCRNFNEKKKVSS